MPPTFSKQYKTLQLVLSALKMYLVLNPSALDLELDMENLLRSSRTFQTSKKSFSMSFSRAYQFSLPNKTALLSHNEIEVNLSLILACSVIIKAKIRSIDQNRK